MVDVEISRQRVEPIGFSFSAIIARIKTDALDKQWPGAFCERHFLRYHRPISLSLSFSSLFPFSFYFPLNFSSFTDSNRSTVFSFIPTLFLFNLPSSACIECRYAISRLTIKRKDRGIVVLRSRSIYSIQLVIFIVFASIFV